MLTSLSPSNTFSTTGLSLGSTTGNLVYGGGSVIASPNTTTFNTPINFSTNQTDQIMQNKVAVFKVTRNEDNKIKTTEFIKELWVETKNGQTVDFAVARDKDLAKYEASELVIKTIFAVTF